MGTGMRFSVKFLLKWQHFTALHQHRSLEPSSQQQMLFNYRRTLLLHTTTQFQYHLLFKIKTTNTATCNQYDIICITWHIQCVKNTVDSDSLSIHCWYSFSRSFLPSFVQLTSFPFAYHYYSFFYNIYWQHITITLLTAHTLNYYHNAD